MTTNKSTQKGRFTVHRLKNTPTRTQSKKSPFPTSSSPKARPKRSPRNSANSAKKVNVKGRFVIALPKRKGRFSLFNMHSNAI